MKKGLKQLTGYLLLMLTLLQGELISAGSASIAIKSNDTVIAYETVSVMVTVDHIQDIESGIATIQGTLVYDDTYFDYVGYENLSHLYGSYGSASKTFLILGMNGENIYQSQNIIKITLRAKKTGSTEITIINSLIGNRNEQVEESSIISKTITIKEQHVDTKVLSTKSVVRKENKDSKQVENTKENITNEEIKNTEEVIVEEKDIVISKETPKKSEQKKKSNLLDSVVNFISSVVDSILS